jgi:nucleotide-binding universal stress UspA family protein
MEIARLAEAVGADLIIVGEQGPRRGVGALLGSTAERVLDNSRVPVLVARKVGETPPCRFLAAIMIGRIVNKAVRNAPCSVLVVTDHDAGGEDATGGPAGR